MNKITRITFRRSENHMIKEGTVVKSMTEANAVLWSALKSMPKEQLGYDKTFFKIEFDDGEFYEGRIDLCKEEHKLDEHVRDLLEFVAGLRRPEWMTDEQYQRSMAVYSDDKAGAAAFLQKYDLS